MSAKSFEHPEQKGTNYTDEGKTPKNELPQASLVAPLDNKFKHDNQGLDNDVVPDCGVEKKAVPEKVSGSEDEMNKGG